MNYRIWITLFIIALSASYVMANSHSSLNQNHFKLILQHQERSLHEEVFFKSYCD